MKSHVCLVLAASSLVAGCMEFPTYPVAARERPAQRRAAPEPVKAEDINADNAHDKARQLDEELDFAEREGESPGSENGESTIED